MSTHPPLPTHAQTAYFAAGWTALPAMVASGQVAWGYYSCPRCEGSGGDPEDFEPYGIGQVSCRACNGNGAVMLTDITVIVGGSR
jgi:hypothetical protein